jgi:DNA-binding transcriptional MerR regulator
MVSRKEQIVTREELEKETGVTSRNIRFLIAEGLLPAPEGSGRGAWYTPKHAAMLKAYAAARSEGITSMAVTAQRMQRAIESRREWTKVPVSEWMTIDVDMERVRQVGLDETVEEARRALVALMKKENG